MIQPLSPLPTHNRAVKSSLWVLSVLASFLVLLAVFAHSYSFAQGAVMVGLTILLLGDVSLVLRGYVRLRFAAYVCASVSYSLAFWSLTSGAMHWWLPILLCSAGVVMLLLILPQVESHFFPTAILGLVLLGLIWASGEWWIQSHQVAAFCGLFASILLFMTSLLLAFRKERCVFYSQNRAFLVSYCLSHGLFTAAVLF